MLLPKSEHLRRVVQADGRGIGIPFLYGSGVGHSRIDNSFTTFIHPLDRANVSVMSATTRFARPSQECPVSESKHGLLD